MTECGEVNLNKHESEYVNVSPATRQRMLAVRRRDTLPEMRVRRVLFAMGYRYRLHVSDLPGTPDVVLPRLRKVVFVHGCFWHGHEGCLRAKLPSKNAVAWKMKVENNKARDDKKIGALREDGWLVLIVWECETNHEERIAAKLREFLVNT
jgi:DNA mismatch endonuclease (patch repair protein)